MVLHNDLIRIQPPGTVHSRYQPKTPVNFHRPSSIYGQNGDKPKRRQVKSCQANVVDGETLCPTLVVVEEYVFMRRD